MDIRCVTQPNGSIWHVLSFDRTQLEAQCNAINIQHTIPETVRTRALSTKDQTLAFTGNASMLLAMQERDPEYANSSICAWEQLQAGVVANSDNSSAYNGTNSTQNVGQSSTGPVRNCSAEYEVYIKDISVKIETIRSATRDASASVAELTMLAEYVRRNLTQMERTMNVQLKTITEQVCT
jgi:hypothetical protein